jgi:hypothetical protein
MEKGNLQSQCNLLDANLFIRYALQVAGDETLIEWQWHIIIIIIIIGLRGRSSP